MIRCLTALSRDEAGFIVSAELVLVSTIVVLGLLVGLSEVSININNELEDVGSAFAAINQSYCFAGACGHKGSKVGSEFKDKAEFCDGQFDITCDHGPQKEGHKR
ncbi:MAG: branched-chain amino acid aminotransferase [Planctomyces sp.]|nr:branched-chain amino acid aminotransferase [Planctomyces sp.]